MKKDIRLQIWHSFEQHSCVEFMKTDAKHSNRQKKSTYSYSKYTTKHAFLMFFWLKISSSNMFWWKLLKETSWHLNLNHVIYINW